MQQITFLQQEAAPTAQRTGTKQQHAPTNEIFTEVKVTRYLDIRHHISVTHIYISEPTSP